MDVRDASDTAKAYDPNVADDDSPIERSIEIFTSMGLTDHEARAYVALLRESPSSAAHVAELAGLPRPRAYDVLTRLIQAGLASVTGTEPKRMFVPLPAARFLERRNERIRKDTEELKGLLSGMTGAAPVDAVYNLRDADEIVQHGIRLISTAKTDVHVAISAEEIDALRSALTSAVKRKIRVHGLLQVDESSKPRTLPPGDFRITDGERGHEVTLTLGRRFIVGADGNEIVCGFIHGAARPRGILSTSRVVIALLEQFVRLERLMADVESKLGKDRLKELLGSDFESVLATELALRARTGQSFDRLEPIKLPKT